MLISLCRTISCDGRDCGIRKNLPIPYYKPLITGFRSFIIFHSRSQFRHLWFEGGFLCMLVQRLGLEKHFPHFISCSVNGCFSHHQTQSVRFHISNLSRSEVSQGVMIFLAADLRQIWDNTM